MYIEIRRITLGKTNTKINRHGKSNRWIYFTGTINCDLLRNSFYNWYIYGHRIDKEFGTERACNSRNCNSGYPGDLN